MKLEIDCPHGEYRSGMRIFCKKANNWCANQRFKSCKGWWVLNDNAAHCPNREVKK